MLSISGIMANVNVLKPNNNVTSLLLRIALAFVFLYAALDSLASPMIWVGFLPPVLTSHINGQLLLSVMSVYEILLSLWLLSGRFTRLAALLAALTLAGITLANLSQFITTFRDVGLLLSALALFYASPKSTGRKN